jgi:hypothetical protein
MVFIFGTLFPFSEDFEKAADIFQRLLRVRQGEPLRCTDAPESDGLFEYVLWRVLHCMHA